MSKNYEIVNGIAYPIAGRAVKVRRPKKAKTTVEQLPLKERCIKWVKNHRPNVTKVVKETKGEYTRANGIKVQTQRLTFDNGETYNIGTHKFWKQK